jgi:hypothetical protein
MTPRADSGTSQSRGLRLVPVNGSPYCFHEPIREGE